MDELSIDNVEYEMDLFDGTAVLAKKEERFTASKLNFKVCGSSSRALEKE